VEENQILEMQQQVITKFNNGSFKDGVELRGSYQWIPTDILVNANGKVKLMSPIHNLDPVLQNMDFYKLVAHVFRKMVPLFAKVNIINRDRDTNLQVVIKAQSYHIPSRQSYSGHWHVEGFTENIIAAGVYYLEIPDELWEGGLKFRPHSNPHPMYNIDTDIDVRVKQGSALVFSNTLPHRFKKIFNNTEREIRRTFINFFIVDPTKPLTSCGTLINVLGNNYISRLWPEKELAVAFRERVRQLLKQLKSGWGYIFYGNCGVSKYLSDREKDMERDMFLAPTTDSDGNEK